MFPDYPFYYTNYIQAPGWVNFLILWLKIFGNFDGLFYFLCLLNFIVLFLVYKIADKLFANSSIKYLAAYIYMLIPNILMSAITVNTEIPFAALSTLAFLLVLYRRYDCWILSAILIALALWIRPVASAWVIGGLYYLIWVHKKWAGALTYFSTFVLTCTFIACMTHRNFPDYIYKSTTASINLMGSCGPDATGGYCDPQIFNNENGLGYVPDRRDTTRTLPVRGITHDNFIYADNPKWSYKQLDSIFTARSIDWLTNHPFQYLSLIPRKIHYLFSGTLNFTGIIKEPACIVVLNKISVFIGIWIIRFLFLISLLGLLTPFWKNKELLYLVLTIVIVCANTLVVHVEGRYNYTFITLFIIFAAYSLSRYYAKARNWDKSKNKYELYKNQK
jgi:hypothetical protein